jgi:hypothetical protein
VRGARTESKERAEVVNCMVGVCMLSRRRLGFGVFATK